jgi:hypothetical protein
MSQQTEQFDSHDHAWRIYLNCQEMIKYADQKVQVTIALAALITSFALSKLDKFDAVGSFEQFIIGAFVIATATFFYFALAALLARSDTKTGDSVPKLIYFGHISKRADAEEYRRCFLETEPHRHLDDLLFQIAELGDIASKKFTNYRSSWVALAFMIIFFVILAMIKATSSSISAA